MIDDDDEQLGPFQPFGLKFGLKIRGAHPPPPPETSSKSNQGEKCF